MEGCVMNYVLSFWEANYGSSVLEMQYAKVISAYGESFLKKQIRPSILLSWNLVCFLC